MSRLGLALLMPRFVEMPTQVLVKEKPRTCGECTLCCNLQGVLDLSPPKPACTDCKHMNSGRALRRHGGCGIYKRRPPTCQDYKCLWLEGLGEEEDRPDKIGAVFEFIPENLARPGEENTHFILVRVVKKGVEMTQRVANLIRFCKVEQRVPVAVLEPEAARKAGPKTGWRLEIEVPEE